MKICIFHPDKFNGSIGGTDIYVRQHIDFLRLNGDEIIMFYPSEENEEFWQFEIRCIGLEMYKSHSYRSLEGGITYSGLKFFGDRINEFVPNIIHFHGFGKMFLPFLRLAKETNIKCILTIHLSSFTCMITSLIDYNNCICDGKVTNHKCSNCLIAKKTKSNKYINLHTKFKFFSSLFNNYFPYSKLSISASVSRQKMMLKMVNTNIDKIIVLNNWYKEVLLRNEFSKDKIHVLPTTFKNSWKRNMFNKEELTILFFGRVNQSKGIFLLLEALLCYNRTTKLTIKLFGTIQKQDAHCLKLAIRNINSDLVNIQILGQVSNEVVRVEMTKGVLVCVPSIDSEMCPLTILEAQSLGTPVLGANHTGIKDLINDGKTGILFNSNDKQDLIDKIHDVIDNPSILGQINCFLKDFNFEKSHLHENYKIYKEILS